VGWVASGVGVRRRRWLVALPTTPRGSPSAPIPLRPGRFGQCRHQDRPLNYHRPGPRILSHVGDAGGVAEVVHHPPSAPRSHAIGVIIGHGQDCRGRSRRGSWRRDAARPRPIPPANPAWAQRLRPQWRRAGCGRRGDGEGRVSSGLVRPTQADRARALSSTVGWLTVAWRVCGCRLPGWQNRIRPEFGSPTAKTLTLRGSRGW
jgi:hypothetical protein